MRPRRCTKPRLPSQPGGTRRSPEHGLPGTLVSYGQGLGVVVATGEQTEIGRISILLEQVEAIATPLLRQVAQFGRWLSLAILVVAGATFAIGCSGAARPWTTCSWRR